jgi:hypothetical protein
VIWFVEYLDFLIVWSHECSSTTKRMPVGDLKVECYFSEAWLEKRSGG